MNHEYKQFLPIFECWFPVFIEATEEEVEVEVEEEVDVPNPFTSPLSSTKVSNLSIGSFSVLDPFKWAERNSFLMTFFSFNNFPW